MVRDYSSRSEASIAYCDDVMEVRYGEGREMMRSQTGCASSVTRHEVREYYISRDVNLSASSAEDSETLRFSVQSSSCELELPTSQVLPPSTIAKIIESDLVKFPIQWSLESSINNDVIHNFTQGLYAVTYLSSKFVLPKSRVVEIVGLGLTEAAKHFTMGQWETAFSYSLEVIRYKNATCSFLVCLFCLFFSKRSPSSFSRYVPGSIA